MVLVCASPRSLCFNALFLTSPVLIPCSLYFLRVVEDWLSWSRSPRLATFGITDFPSRAPGAKNVAVRHTPRRTPTTRRTEFSSSKTGCTTVWTATEIRFHMFHKKLR